MRWIPSPALSAAAALAALLASATPSIAIPTRNLTLEAAFNDYPPGSGYGYSSCWSYVHGDGREYAVIGAMGGTAIYHVTDPPNARFVGFIPGPNSLWREMKSYRSWIYVVTEGAGGTGQPAPGLQIIRMTDPENPVLAGTYAVNFSRAHTVSVDSTRALLYCNGTRNASGQQTGMRILSLANPEAPVEIGRWPGGTIPIPTAQYIHDSAPIGDRLYGSSVYSGIQRILDVSNPAAPVEIHSWTYPGAGFTHNAWPDATGDYLYVTDEQNGQPLRAFDIRTETAPVLVNEWTSNPGAIIHNAHVLGDDLWLANYTEGIRVLDASDPAHPAQFGWADTYPGPSGGFSGVWGVCPYFPSGTVIASDMQTGLYVFRVQRNYGLLRVQVTDGANPLAGVVVQVTTQGDSVVTSADGIAQFAPDPGAHAVLATKFGYFPAAAGAGVTQGGRDTITLVLPAKPVTTFTGQVRSSLTDQPLAEGEVDLRYSSVHDHTAADGGFDLGSVPIDVYRVDVRRPGSIPLSFDRQIGPAATSQTFLLTPAPYWDAMTTGAGWSIGDTGDNAVSGVWTRVEPLGTILGGTQPEAVSRPVRDYSSAGDPQRSRPGLFHEGHEAEGANAGPVQPERDRSPAPDSLCWATGQGASATMIDEADVDGPGNTPGRTTLTSPAYDAAGMTDPVLGFWQWFYTQFGGPDDWLAVSISSDGGASWVAVDTVTGLHNHWEERAVRIADYVTPSSEVRLRFVAADLGTPTVVEAAIDDLTLYDAATPAASSPWPGVAARLDLRVTSANPARGPVELAATLPHAGPLAIDIVDVTGRLVRTLHRGPAAAGTLRSRWDGTGADGGAAPAGLYFARARVGGDTATLKIVRVISETGH